MIFLYILLGLIALILLLLCVPVKVRLRLDENGALKIRVSAALFPVVDVPSKPKRFRQRDYSPRAIAKRERKLAKKAERDSRKKAKKRPKTTQPTESKKKPTLSQRVTKLTDTLSLFTSLIDALHGKLFRSTHVHIRKLSIRVGTEDAAKTALLYGVICPAARGLLEAINECSNLHLYHPEQMRVLPDFAANTFSAELDISISLRIFHALSLGIDALKHVIRHKQSKARRLPPTHQHA